MREISEVLEVVNMLELNLMLQCSIAQQFVMPKPKVVLSTFCQNG